MLLDVGILLLLLLNPGVTDFGYAGIITLTLGTLGIEIQLFDLDLILLNSVDQILLSLPFGCEILLTVTQIGKLLFNLLHLRLVTLALDSLPLYLFLSYKTGYLVKSLRYRIDFKTQLGCSLVNKIDSLVREETIGDVTFRQSDRCYDSLVTDTYLVVVLVTLLKSAQDSDSSRLIRLIHHHFLETAFESLVLFKILLVLIKSRRTDGAQLTAGERGLENIGGIHGTLTLTGTHKSVDLVDKEDDFTIGSGHFIDDSLQTLLKLAFILCTGNKGTHVKRVYLLAAQILGHVTAHNPLCKPLGDSGLAGARLTDEHRVVLRASRKDLEHSAYLVITTDDRIELTFAGTFIQVNGIFG